MVKAKSNNSGVFEETQFEKEERKKKKKGKKGAKEPQSALVNRKSTLDDLGDGWLHNTGKTRKESEKKDSVDEQWDQMNMDEGDLYKKK